MMVLFYGYVVGGRGGFAFLWDLVNSCIRESKYFMPCGLHSGHVPFMLIKYCKSLPLSAICQRIRLNHYRHFIKSNFIY